jgi:hypothetical protein
MVQQNKFESILLTLESWQSTDGTVGSFTQTKLDNGNNYSWQATLETL